VENVTGTIRGYSTRNNKQKRQFPKVGNWRQAHFFYNCWLVGRIMPMVEYSEPRREQGFF
jgi:hypothetical protein